jgi:Protein of unknown function (DUF3570)
MQLKGRRRTTVNGCNGADAAATPSTSRYLAAALTLPGIAVAPISVSEAQTIPQFTTARLQYGYYRDYQRTGDRMEIHAPMGFIHAPISDSTEIEASTVLDTMSGASPLYLDTLSGASGTGVKDNRWAGDLKVTEHWQQFSLGAGLIYSTEDDYRSRGGVIESRWWTPDKNTTVVAAFSGNGDNISSTNDSSIDEFRRTYNLLLGVTQVMSPRSAFQSNLTLSTGDGYFSDPYKTFDHRPRSRDQMAWLGRWVLSVPEAAGSFHADYRFTHDSWGVSSHMLDLAWFQELGAKWLVRPSVRWFTQGDAEFFTGRFPPPQRGVVYSADQRLSSFGALTVGGLVAYQITETVSVDLSYEFLQQRDSLRPGGGTEGLEPFFAHFLIAGVTKQFR